MDIGSSNSLENEDASSLQQSLLTGSIDNIQEILRQDYGAKLLSHNNEVQKCKEIVEVCLDLKNDVFLLNSKYSSLLHFVAHKDDADLFKLVLKRSKNFNINALYKGRALLHFLINEEKENFVKALLKFGADVNLQDFEEDTPLQYTVMKYNPRLFQLLLEYGATIHYQHYLLMFPCGCHEFWFLHVDMVKLLLKAGCDVSAEKNGILPIEDIFPFERNGFPSYGQYFHRWEIVKLLCEHGAEMSLKGESGTALLHDFCKTGLLDDVRFSIKYGADLFSIESGNTTLHRAVYGNNLELVDFLLRNGLDINAKDPNNGETPLHRLAKFSSDSDNFPGLGPEFWEERTKELVAMIKFLVDNGANVNAVDNNFASPVERSIFLNLLEITECFLELKTDTEFHEDIVFISIINASSNQYAEINSRKNNAIKLLIAFLATKDDNIDRYIQRVNDVSMFLRIRTFFERCKVQTNKMKSRKICRHRNISFFDFLSKDLMEVAIFCRNEEVMRVLESGKYKSNFPCYKLMFEKRLETVQLLRNCINVLTSFLGNFFKKQLPLVALDNIFTFLRAGDVRNFARALSISKDYPSGQYYIK